MLRKIINDLDLLTPENIHQDVEKQIIILRNIMLNNQSKWDKLCTRISNNEGRRKIMQPPNEAFIENLANYFKKMQFLNSKYEEKLVIAIASVITSPNITEEQFNDFMKKLDILTPEKPEFLPTIIKTMLELESNETIIIPKEKEKYLKILYQPFQKDQISGITIPAHTNIVTKETIIKNTNPIISITKKQAIENLINITKEDYELGKKILDKIKEYLKASTLSLITRGAGSVAGVGTANFIINFINGMPKDPTVALLFIFIGVGVGISSLITNYLHQKKENEFLKSNYAEKIFNLLIFYFDQDKNTVNRNQLYADLENSEYLQTNTLKQDLEAVLNRYESTVLKKHYENNKNKNDIKEDSIDNQIQKEIDSLPKQQQNNNTSEIQLEP